MLTVGDDVPDVGTTMTRCQKQGTRGVGGLWKIMWLVMQKRVPRLAGSGLLGGAGTFLGSQVPRNFINGFVIIIFMFCS